MAAHAVRVVFVVLALAAVSFAVADEGTSQPPPLHGPFLDCAIGTPTVAAELVGREGSELSFRVTAIDSPTVSDPAVDEVVIVRFDDGDDADRFLLGNDYLVPLEELTPGGLAMGDAEYASLIDDDGPCAIGATLANGDEIHGPWSPTWWLPAIASVMVVLAITVWTRIPRTGAR